MKAPLQLTLSIWQGQTFDEVLTFKDDSTGDLIDLTGYEAHLQARPDVGSDTVIVDWSTQGGDMVIDGANGTLTFAVDADATYALPTSNEVALWFYDLRLLLTATGYAERAAEGVIVVYPAVTRGST